MQRNFAPTDVLFAGNKKEYNLVQATATVTSETGARLSGVLISGRFMDQYWTNARVSGTTNSQGGPEPRVLLVAAG
jgi:hypothetical protein